LGRLAWEIHAKGYTVQGSDFSLPMLLASDFILNGCAIHDDSAENGSGGASGHRQFNISPWMAETKNVTSFENRIRSVIVPDVDPSSIQDLCHGDGEPPQFSMLAGEFLALYSHFLPENRNCNHDHTHKSEKFHSIACSFFLDTAPSLPEYLITIHHMLEDGGMLSHFGPLMYHWSGHGALIPKDLSGNTSIDDVNRRHRNRNAYLDVSFLIAVCSHRPKLVCLTLFISTRSRAIYLALISLGKKYAR
jgi:carnosine N-methyltransferase